MRERSGDYRVLEIVDYQKIETSEGCSAKLLTAGRAAGAPPVWMEARHISDGAVTAAQVADPAASKRHGLATDQSCSRAPRRR